MLTEPYPEKDGRRCWLSRPEQAALRDHYGDDPEKQLAVELCLHGLRADEVRRVQADHSRARDVQDDRESYALTVPEGKTGHRETPLRGETNRLMTIYAGATDADGPLIDRSRRTIRRWVDRAAETVIDGSHAEAVGPHDLRRTWATDTYWTLAFAGYDAEIVVMSWGGWDDRDTFRDNYLGRVPDHVATDMPETANLS